MTRIHVFTVRDAQVQSLRRQGYLTLQQGGFPLQLSELVELRSSEALALGRVILANQDIAIVELLSRAEGPAETSEGNVEAARP